MKTNQQSIMILTPMHLLESSELCAILDFIYFYFQWLRKFPTKIFRTFLAFLLDVIKIL